MTTSLAPQVSAPSADMPRAQQQAPLTFITCGSVDDGKSTLIGRLLLDSRALLQDQLSSAQRAAGQHAANAVDLASVTDGLSAEREQGITIDVAWRYFSTATRKFIIGDSPGHEQYTRNMVTAASQAEAAVVLVDATKVDWQLPLPQLLPQTRRHSLLARLLRVPHVVFAVNKLDAVSEPALAFAHIRAALQQFTQDADWPDLHVLPISALKGHNVVDATPGWAGYDGPSLLQWLERCSPAIEPGADAPAHFSVQWVEKQHDLAETAHARRILWGRVLQGSLRVGDRLRINDGVQAQVASLRHVRGHLDAAHVATPGDALGVVLDAERDVSRGDALLGLDTPEALREFDATVAWLDTQALSVGRSYWALHGHRWVKAKVQAIHHQVNIETLKSEATETLQANAIGRVRLKLQTPLPVLPFTASRALGRLILVDTATHATAAAVLVD